LRRRDVLAKEAGELFERDRRAVRSAQPYPVELLVQRGSRLALPLVRLRRPPLPILAPIASPAAAVARHATGLHGSPTRTFDRYRAAIPLLERGEITGTDALTLICWPPTGSPLVYAQAYEKTYHESLRDEARRLYDDGMTCRQVAQRIGVPCATVKSWVSADGRRRSQRHNATS
jgi:hypothetical protein